MDAKKRLSKEVQMQSNNYYYNDTCMHMAVTVLIQSRDLTTCGIDGLVLAL